MSVELIHGDEKLYSEIEVRRMVSRERDILISDLEEIIEEAICTDRERSFARDLVEELRRFK